MQDRLQELAYLQHISKGQVLGGPEVGGKVHFNLCDQITNDQVL
jgi:hypothetical protein